MSKTIGILGGMGPAATVDLFQKIITNTPVQTDQEHFRIIVYNNPKIPPRIDGSKPSFVSPLPELKKTAITLEQAGADFIIMPCVTAHIWFGEIQRVINIPFYHIVENTVETLLQQKNHDKGSILLLATETAIQHQLYQNAFYNTAYKIVVPKPEEQKVVDHVIMNVKAGKTTTNPYIRELNEILGGYQKQGISMLLGGCTEIPLIFHCLKDGLEMVDPVLMLAKMAIEKAT